MSTLFPDTQPEAELLLLGLLRQAPSWRKLEMLGQMNRTAQTLALTGLQQRYPQDSPETIRRRLADLLLGPELAEKVYGPLIATELPHAE